MAPHLHAEALAAAIRSALAEVINESTPPEDVPKLLWTAIASALHTHFDACYDVRYMRLGGGP
jgi:hypothetical protein